MAVNKIDPKVIFASEAPAQDTPAIFTNRTVGWGETRKNGGRPTIKQMNAEQQSTDLKILWLNENSVTPYDPTIDYPVDAVTIKDGIFKIFNGTIWDVFLDKSDIGLGNVDNTSDLNKPVSTASQEALDLKADKNYVDTSLPHNNLIDRNSIGAHEAVAILSDNGDTQQQINNRGGATWYAKSGGYGLNDRVILSNGDIVISTASNNTANPNVDMTDWVFNTTKSKAKLSTKISTTSDFGDLSITPQNKLLSDLYATLALAQLDFPFVTDLTGSYGWAVLQKQFNAISVNNFEEVVVSGDFHVNKTLNFASKKQVKWNINLILNSGIAGQKAIIFDNCDNSKHTGVINLSCYTTDTYDVHNWSIRSWYDGIEFRRVVGADFSGLYINGRLKGQLVNIDGISYNGNYAQYGFIQGTCGSRAGDISKTISSKVNNGTENTTSQTTTITLSSNLDFNVAGSVAVIGGEPYNILSSNSNTITVSSWVSETAPTLDIIYGGICKAFGNNANQLSFQVLRGFRSARTYVGAVSYGSMVGILGSEFNAIGLQVGIGANDSILATDINEWYSEFNDIDIIDTRLGRIQVLDDFIKIGSNVGVSNANWPSKIVKISPKSSALVPFYANKQIPLILNGAPVDVLYSKTLAKTVDEIYFPFGSKDKIKVTGKDTATITLTVDNISNKMTPLGFTTLEVIHTGLSNNGGSDRLNFVCEFPYTFENASEANGRYKYLPKTDRPRKVIVVLVGTVFKVFNINDVGGTPITDLSVNLRNGEYYVTAAATANRGANPPSTAIIKSHNVSSDFFINRAVEESYEVVSGKVVKKIRLKDGATVSDWVDLVTEQMAAIPDLNTGAATTAQIATKVNDLLAAMRLIKILKP